MRSRWRSCPRTRLGIPSRTTRWLARGDAPLYQFKYPSLVSIFVTNRCNLRCEHCCFGAGTDQAHEMSRGQLFKIIDRVSECGIVCLDFSGGEPFTRSDLLDAVEHAFRKGIQSVSIATNMTLLRGTTVERLKALQDRHRLLYLRVSLDGADAHTHEWLRGTGTFAVALNRLDLLRDAGINLREVNMVVSKRNYAQVEGVIELAAGYGAKTVVLLPLIPVGRASSLREYLIAPEEWKLLCEKKHYFQSTYQVEVFADSPVSSTLNPANAGRTLPCMCAQQFLGIGPDGSYTVCPIASIGDGSIWSTDIETFWRESNVSLYYL